MLGQTFVYRSNTRYINHLYGLADSTMWLENPSESLGESGLRPLRGKTFRAHVEDVLPAAGLVRSGTSQRLGLEPEGSTGIPLPRGIEWARQDPRHGAHDEPVRRL
jgi:hypothetical protein